jgi:hypothetical protein
MATIPNPWISEGRFILDERQFVTALEAPPAFLDMPSRDYLEAVQLRPIVETLAEFMA